jgi:hypothetical protein
VTVVTEGNLELTFPVAWKVERLDRWSFRKRFGSAFGGTKDVDVVALDPNHGLWLIELKNFAHWGREKEAPLWDDLAFKVRDTLAGLVTAAVKDDGPEGAFAKECVSANDISIVLHAEQQQKPSRLFPLVFDPADLTSKLKQLLKPIDPHPRVVSCASPLPGCPWTSRVVR